LKFPSSSSVPHRTFVDAQRPAGALKCRPARIIARAIASCFSDVAAFTLYQAKLPADLPSLTA
jgi:hypothetical protein